MALTESVGTQIDLSGYAVMGSFARSTQSARMLAFLMRLDAVDGWAVDFKEDEAVNALNIKGFVSQLQAFLNDGGVDWLQAAPDEFLALLGGLRSSRCLYLLREATQRNHELADQVEKLLVEADGTDRLVSVVRRRLEAFTRAQLLGEIFSSSRLERIKSIMGKQNGAS